MDIRISDAEYAVMQVLWDQSPLTAEQVVHATAESNGWEGNTVRTLLNRLLKKQAIAAERVDRKYLYAPLVPHEAVLRAESESFLNKLFDGRVAPLVSHLSRDNKLSEQDIAELKRLIEDIEDDG